MNQANLQAKMNILTAAKKLFAIQGYEKTTVRQICDEAGVNLMMVSYHFRGKENVLSAIFQTFMPLVSASNSIEELKDPVKRIKQIIYEITSLRIKDPDLVIVMQQLILCLAPQNELVKWIIIPIWKELRDLLVLGKDCGLFMFDSVDITLTFVISSILMFKHWDFFDLILQDPGEDNDSLAKEASKFVLNALNYRGY